MLHDDLVVNKSGIIVFPGQVWVYAWKREGFGRGRRENEFEKKKPLNKPNNTKIKPIPKPKTLLNLYLSFASVSKGKTIPIPSKAYTASPMP